MTRLKLYVESTSPVFVPSDFSKVFINNFGMHDMFARLEKNKWEFVEDITKADVVPCLIYNWNDEFVSLLNQLVRTDQILLVMNLFHNDDQMTDEWFRGPNLDIVRNLQHKTLIVHNNNYDTSDPKYIFYDILLNRQKYYMFDMEDDFYPETKVWTRNSRKEFYTAGPINKNIADESKKILCLNRLYWDESIVRNQKTLRTMLRNKFLNKDDVYLSDPPKDIFLYPNHAENNTIDVRNTSGTWYPAADFYYNNSYVSAYVESVVQSSNNGKIFCATEKTYDPLVKGNFILPFSTPNFIYGLKQMYGFRFPNWIDYSYDQIIDFDQRVNCYMESVDKVYQMDLQTLHQHYINDKDILDYNRNLIKQIPYSGLHDKVVESANHFGWL